MIVVLVDCMSNVVDDHHFEFALHLGNSQLLVQTLFLGCQKDLGDVDG